MPSISVSKFKDIKKLSYINLDCLQGPYKQYKGRGKATGPITLVLYEDPEDKIPKIHCRCDNYMAWIQEQKMPLHLHVGRDKKIMFDQVKWLTNCVQTTLVFFSSNFIVEQEAPGQLCLP